MAVNVGQDADDAFQAMVCDAVVHPVGVLARGEQGLVAQDAQMLGDVRLRGADRFTNFADCPFALGEQADDGKTQRVSHRLESLGGGFNIVVAPVMRHAYRFR